MKNFSLIDRNKEYTDAEKLEIVDAILSDIRYAPRMGNEKLVEYTTREDRPDRPMKFVVGEKYTGREDSTIEITKITEKYVYFKYVDFGTRSNSLIKKSTLQIGKVYRGIRHTHSVFYGIRHEMDRFSLPESHHKWGNDWTVYACDNVAWEEKIANEIVERKNEYYLNADRSKMKNLWTTTR